MTLIRLRITDYHDISTPQSALGFAIPFFDEDIPLHVDPFLLWKSPSLQDQALHTTVTNSFNNLNYLIHHGKEDEAREILVLASECDETGLGHSKNRRGKRIGRKKADEIVGLFRTIDEYKKHGFIHFEEIQLYVKDIAEDRVSDICCNFFKSFLIDFTVEECQSLGIPIEDCTVPLLYSYHHNKFLFNQEVRLPVNPETKSPLIFVPKRWLRYNTWINFDEYFRDYCPRDEIFNPGEPEDPVKVLRYNREHYGLVRDYVQAKERKQEDCRTDPLFQQIPVLSAKRKMQELRKLPTGKESGADRKYEDLMVQLLASLFYPYLDFAAKQSRTESGTLIRDLIFYNNRSIEFLEEIHQNYGNRQLVFEMKNVALIERDHINQLNRYLNSGLGKFGVFLTRKALSKAMFTNTIDLWSGQRRCIIALTDEDVLLMVTLFESKQRSPLDVLKKKYVEFRRACPG
jgi:hypothetical protein